MRGGATMLTAQVVLLCISTASSAILARLLSPSDFGTIAMVTAVIGLAGVFKDLGLSTSTIQRSTISHGQVSTLFWVNASVGCVISLVVATLAPAVAWFYGQRDLLYVTLAIAPTFALSGLGIQHQALLNRQMRFRAVASIQTASSAIGAGVAIGLALYGWRYWALVVNALVQAAIAAVGPWLLCNWRPGPPVRGAGVRSMLRFGADITACDVVNYLSRNMDNVLIGRFHGSTALGYYGKAYHLLMLPISRLRAPLASVALPAMSRLNSDPDRYRAYYVKLISTLAFVSMPFVAFLFVCSENIVGLLLGPQWGYTSSLFRVLAVATFVQPVVSTGGLVLLSSGRGARYLRWGVYNAIATISSFIVGVPWGPTGVAVAYATVSYLVLYPSLWYVFQGSHIRLVDFCAALWKPAMASLLMALAASCVHARLVGTTHIGVIALCLPLCVGAYVGFWALMPGGCRSIQEYLSYAALVFKPNPTITADQG